LLALAEESKRKSGLSAPAAGIAPPSLATPAEIGIAQNVRPRLGNAGSQHVKENFSRRATSMWSSHFLRSLFHWLCRTRKSFTICCFAPVQKHFSKSLAMRNTSARKSFFTVLHTWNQQLGLHPHVHCVIPAGGLSLDDTHWVKSTDRFFLPIHVLRRVFRGNFVAALRQATTTHEKRQVSKHAVRFSRYLQR
jgi:hypothetical protein